MDDYKEMKEVQKENEVVLNAVSTYATPPCTQDHNERIRAVFTKHIAEEVMYKEKELASIEEQILNTRVQLHRIRLVILSQEYGLNLTGQEPGESLEKDLGETTASWRDFEQRFISEQSLVESSEPPSCVGTPLSSNPHSHEPSEHGSDDERDGVDILDEEMRDENNGREPSAVDIDPFDINMAELNSVLSTEEENVRTPVIFSALSSSLAKPSSESNNESRFYTKRRVIVGNTSQYLERSFRFDSDSSTHKWMVYVRGTPGDQPIHTYVRAVRFFLHPSYRPHNIVQVNDPPFNLTRFGWGEFPVRAQLIFQNSRQKSIDIIHNLKLDRTHTGQQMLGAETTVDIELEKQESASIVQSCFQEASQLQTQEPTYNDVGVMECSVGSKLLMNAGTVCIPTHGSRNASHSAQNIHGNDYVDRCVAGYSSQAVYHITIPTTCPLDTILLDHDYSTNVIVRQASLSVSKQQQGLLTAVSYTPSPNYFSSLYAPHTVADSHLHFAASLLPLYAPLNPDACPFAAATLEEYRNWSLPKQRANEWMRAVAVKKLTQLRMDQPKVNECPLTTRYVMLWCRRNGFTPLDIAMESSPGFCKYCGHQLPPYKSHDDGERLLANYHIECEVIFMESGGLAQLNSFTSPYQLLKSLATEMESSVKEEDYDQLIDVETFDLDHSQPIPLDIAPFIKRQPSTPELRWVQLTALQIGVHLSPILHTGKVLHVVEHMIYVACSRFLKDLLKLAVQFGLSRPETESDITTGSAEGLQERVIVALHIYRAIKHNENMDFLTNEGLAYSCLDSK